MAHKLTNALSFKVSDPMKQRILEECGKDNGRSEVDMTRILIAEALVIRDAQGKSNMQKYI